MITSKIKWYQRTPAIILLLFIFFPLGAFLMWRYANWNMFVKAGVSMLLVFAFIGLISSSTTPSNSQPTIKQAVAKKPTQTLNRKPSVTSLPTGTSPKCDVATMDGTQFDLCLRHNFPLPAIVKTNGVVLYITNPQTVDWTGCNVESADGVFAMNGYDSFNVPAGETESLGWGRLTDENGNRLNYLQKQPGPINITCFIGKQQYEGQFQGF